MSDEHPTLSELELYLEGGAERSVSKHVDGCETCSGRLAELRVGIPRIHVDGSVYGFSRVAH